MSVVHPAKFLPPDKKAERRRKARERRERNDEKLYRLWRRCVRMFSTCQPFDLKFLKRDCANDNKRP